MEKRIILFLLPLVLLVGVLGGISALPGVHAVGSLPFCTVSGQTGCQGGVCLNDPSQVTPGANPCPTSPYIFNGPFPVSPELSPQQIRVGVYINSSQSMGGFTVILISSHTVLKAAGVDLTGSVLQVGSGNIQIFAECLDLNLVHGPACSGADTQDTLDLSAGVPLGSGNTAGPITGLLFTAIFNVTAATATAGIPVGFQTSSAFCGGSSTTQAGQTGNFCVSVSSPPGTTPTPEIVQTGTTFDNSLQPTWVAITAPTSTIAAQLGAASPTATITATAENGYPGLFSNDIIAFTSVATPGFTAPTVAPPSCGTTGTSCSVTATFSTQTAGAYSATIFATYVADNCGTAGPGPCSGASYTLVGTISFVVNVQSVGFTINGAAFNTAQTVFMAKTQGSPLFLVTAQSLGGYTGTITYTQNTLSAGATGMTATSFIYPAAFTLGAGQTITKAINATAPNEGSALYKINQAATGLATKASGLLTIKVSGFSITPASTTATFTTSAGSTTDVVTLASLGNPASPNGFTGAVALSTTVSPVTGLFANCSPSPVTVPVGGTVTSTCTFTSSTANTYTVTITATGGTNNDMTNSTAVTVTVTGLANPTSTSLTCSSPVVDNQASSCTATVTQTSGTLSFPTGSISFTTNSTGTFSPAASCALASTATPGVSNCTVSYTPTVLGHHLLTATYAGDTSHTGSSGSFTLTSTKRATTTTVACSPSSVNTGMSTTCTATVADSSGTGAIAPTGTVTFTTNSTGTFTSTTCTLSAGACSVSYSQPSAGHALITGTYGGDGVHTGSSGTFLLAVTQGVATTTTTVSCSPASVLDNVASSCTATVTSGTGTPTGTVTFTTNSTGTFSSTTCTLSTGTCSVTYTPTLVGHHLITGTYGGDSSHSGSAGTFTLASTKRATTTTVSCSPASVNTNSATSCTATVADSSGTGAITPTGTVTFTTNSTGTFTSTTCTLSAGSCSVSYTPTVTGHHLITGTYGGDSIHTGSPGTFNLPVGVTVNATTTTVSCSPASVVDNTPTTCTVTVTSSSGTPSGTVTFTTNSTGTFNSTTCTLTSGSCSVTYTPTVVGHHLVTGTYSGDSSHSGSSGSFVVTSTIRLSATTVSCSPASVLDNNPTTCTATVGDGSTTGAIIPTGTVTFSTNSTGTFSSTTCTLSAGSCSVTYTPTVVGHALITGTYGGDSVHTGSNGTFTVASTKRATTTTVSCSPASVNANQATSCTATVADSSGTGAVTPTGTVTFTTNSTGTFSSTTCTLSAGACTVTYTPTVVGHALITGTYGGDTVHTGSSGTFNLPVGQNVFASTTTVNCSPASVLDNTPTSCTATVTSTSGTPTGTVTFTTNSTGTFSTTSCTLASGSCSVTYTPTVVGHALITGTYGGDSSHTGSSGTFTVASTKRATTTTVSCSPAAVNTGVATTCTATVADSSGAGGVTPTGTVTFTSNSTGTFSSTSCTLASGSCSVTYTPTVAGHHLITGTYSGDSVHTGSSGTFNLAVGVTLVATTTAVNCSPASVPDNTLTSCTASVTSSSGTPTGTVTFTTNSTGTFSSTTCTLGAGNCSVSYMPTVAGHHLITGSYTGDSSHSSSTGTFVLAATPAPAHATTTSVACASSSVNVGTSTTCTATVTDTSSSPTTPTGTVGFTTNSTGTFGSTTCTLAGTTTGTASCTVSYTPTVVGHHLVTGSYGGDPTHSASQGTFTLAATPAPIHATTTSVTCSPSSVTVNTASTCTAKVTDTSASPTSPTGSVTFTTNSTGTFSPISASCALVAGATTGTAQCGISYTPTVTGHHLITGSYSGDTSHTSSSGSFNLASTPVTTTAHPTQTNVTCSPGSVTVNTATSCTARVIDTSTSPTTPTGTVAFTTNSTGSFAPSASCTLAAGNSPGMATCSVSYTSTVAGHQLITGVYSGDSGHTTSSGSFTVNVRLVQGKPVLLTFTGSLLDDFDNGVGQLNVVVNGQLVVDVPAGLNHLTGTGDFDAFDSITNFGPFDITSFIVTGQNTILFRDPTAFDHFGLVSNIVITQDGSVLLNAPRTRGVYPAFSFSYTFSSTPLTVTSFAPLDSSNNVVRATTVDNRLSFTVMFAGGTGPFTCFFSFGDGDHATVAGSNGVCSASHSFDSAGTFDVTVTIRGASTSDLVRGHFSIPVTGDPATSVAASLVQTGDAASSTS